MSEKKWHVYPLDEGAERWEFGWILKLLSGVDIVVESSGFWEALENNVEPTILILNAHQTDIMSQLVSEPARLQKALSQHEVGAVIIDEGTVSAQWSKFGFRFVIRLGFGSVESFQSSKNELLLPLGIPKYKNTSHERLSALERRYAWGFVGRVTNKARAKMLQSFLQLSDERTATIGSKWRYAGPANYLLHLTAGLTDETDLRLFSQIEPWNSTLSTSWRHGIKNALGNYAYKAALADIIFAPSPHGSVHPECYRTYEALQAGAIPVVSTYYYRNAFGAPFPVIHDWSLDSIRSLFSLLDNPSQLIDLWKKCQSWWAETQELYVRMVADLLHSRLNTQASHLRIEQYTLHLYGNELPIEINFPVDAQPHELEAIAMQAAQRNELQMGAGCDAADCIVQIILREMYRIIHAHRLPDSILVTAVPFSGAELVTALISASNQNMPVATTAGLKRMRLQCQLSASLECQNTPAPILITQRPFEFEDPLYMLCPESARSERALRHVVHIVGHPLTNYLRWQRAQPALAHTIDLEHFMHRWASHHHYWLAQATEERNVILIRYEDILCGFNTSFLQSPVPMVRSGNTEENDEKAQTWQGMLTELCGILPDYQNDGCLLQDEERAAFSEVIPRLNTMFGSLLQRFNYVL